MRNPKVLSEKTKKKKCESKPRVEVLRIGEYRVVVAKSLSNHHTVRDHCRIVKTFGVHHRRDHFLASSFAERSSSNVLLKPLVGTINFCPLAIFFLPTVPACGVSFAILANKARDNG